MKKILFVDDEMQILKALMRLFMDTQYEIITAQSGIEALEILKNEHINLIVSDMRMPNMDGYELLLKVKELYPKVMRIILSGYSDEKVVFKALQKNIAKLYMFKPWENDKLLALVDQMFETEDVLNNTNLLTLINNIENLPTIESNYQRIINKIDEDSDVALISSLIENDVAMAAKILHVANSAFFGAKTGSVKQAVSYIGLQNTKQLVLSTSIIESMIDTGIIGQSIKNNWSHSFVSNKLLAFIYEKHLKKKIPDEYASAALFHNIGSVFFLKYFKSEYLKLLIKAKNEKKDIILYEVESFKVSHMEAGAYLLKWWDFPYSIIEATLYHHNPMDKKVINHELICAVHISLKYAKELLNIEFINEFDYSVFEVLKISKIDFEASLRDFIV